MESTRRGFLRVVSAGGAALLLGSAGVLARAATPAPKRRARTGAAAAPALTDAMRKEITSQEKSLADTLATVRRFQLAPGSNPAYLFRPLPPRRLRGK